MSAELAFEGRCTRCKQTLVAYYIFADARRKAMMSNGTFMSEDANCPGCVTSKILQTPRTVKWHRKITGIEVQQLLDKETTGGIDIDFKAVDKQAADEAKNDQWIEDNQRRVDEFVKWKQVTEGGTQKHVR
jgi:hypothetical protein